MFYRRKILLALLESFGGSLDSTDFEKLLFLYCRFSNNNHYDFFPYRYGCFSFLSYQDKRVLINQGVLENIDKFSLSRNYRGKKQYLGMLKINDKLSLQKFTALYINKKGIELVKKTYNDFPYYASKSEIAENILNDNELSVVRNSNSFDDSKALFTIGYEGITIDAYINKLIAYNIRLVIDVRKNPLSMKYGFSKTKMKSYLEKAGIKYVHIPQLGIVSELRKNLTSETDYKELFEVYQKEILPNNVEHIEKVIQFINKYKRVALTCFESEHTFCHRHKITEWLENSPLFNEQIVHI